MPAKSCKDFLILVALFTLAGAVAPSAFGRGFAHPNTLEALEPVERRSVLYLSTMGDPALGFGTLNFGYEIDSDWRFTIGGGYFYGAALGMGIRYRIMDNSEELRPFIGVMAGALYSNYASKLSDALMARGASDPYFFSVGGAAGAGLEWKFSSGLYVAVGANLWAWTHNNDTSVVPFFNLGYFFSSKSRLTFVR
jgi:hypothetical protein